MMKAINFFDRDYLLIIKLNILPRGKKEEIILPTS